MRIKQRVHPGISIHAQAERRWSWFDPPLAQLPGDLEDLYIPDPGWPWLTWDWDQAEPRIQHAWCQDPLLLEEIESGVNRYTIFACMLFSLPMVPTPIDVVNAPANADWIREVGWRHKKDKRYKLAKNGVLALGYEKDPQNMMAMPGYRAAGLKRAPTIKAARDWNARYPKLQQWKARLKRDAELQRLVQDHCGARWVFLETDTGALHRKACNGPMQLGVSSIHNLTIVRCKQLWDSDIILKRCKHDFIAFAIREAKWHIIAPAMRALVSTWEWVINGYRTLMPAVFEEVWA